MNPRPDLAQLGLSAGKKARLHRILYEHGLRNGTALFLPYDQGLELRRAASRADSTAGVVRRSRNNLVSGFSGSALVAAGAACTGLVAALS
jgi:hypothetical protein